MRSCNCEYGNCYLCREETTWWKIQTNARGPMKKPEKKYPKSNSKRWACQERGCLYKTDSYYNLVAHEKEHKN